MINENELSKPSRKGLELIKKVNNFIKYLYAGNEYKYNDHTYKMDGDLNPYIVMYEYEGENKYPIFQNDSFWNIVIEIVENMSEEAYEEIQLQAAAITVLNPM